MTCAACVRRIETGLSEMKGVSRVSVNFATEKATVEYDPALVGEGQISKAVVELGYDALGLSGWEGGEIARMAVSVGGMTCAACVRRVEEAIKSVPGVKDAMVNLATSRATVLHGPTGRVSEH